MKKVFKLFVAALMLFTATSANAQFSRKENNRVPDRFHMGLRGGFTISTMSEATGEALFFPYGGFGADFQIAPIPLFMGIGTFYMNRGYETERVYTSYSSYYSSYSGYTSIPTTYTSKDQKDRHSIVIPITLSYHINVAPNLFLNPQIGVVTSFDVEEDDDELVDYSLRVGFGLNFGRLYFDFGYDYGLKDWSVEHYNYGSSYSGKSSTNLGNSGVFFMTLGFNWAGSR